MDPHGKGYYLDRVLELLEDKYLPVSMQGGATDSSLWEGLKLGTSRKEGSKSGSFK